MGQGVGFGESVGQGVGGLGHFVGFVLGHFVGLMTGHLVGLGVLQVGR